MERRLLLVVLLAMIFSAGHAQEERKLWLNYMDRVARPVVSALAEGRLRENMPVVLSRVIDNK